MDKFHSFRVVPLCQTSVGQMLMFTAIILTTYVEKILCSKTSEANNRGLNKTDLMPEKATRKKLIHSKKTSPVSPS